MLGHASWVRPRSGLQGLPGMASIACHLHQVGASLVSMCVFHLLWLLHQPMHCI